MRKKIEKRGILVLLLVMVLSTIQPLIVLAQETIGTKEELHVTASKEAVAIEEEFTLTSINKTGIEEELVASDGVALIHKADELLKNGEKKTVYTLKGTKAGNQELYIKVLKQEAPEVEEQVVQTEDTTEKEVVTQDENSSIAKEEETVSEEVVTEKTNPEEIKSNIVNVRVKKKPSLEPRSSLANGQVKPLKDTDYEKPSDRFDVFLINTFLTGNHSAESADTEGPIAVMGNSYIPNGGRFNYGAFYDNPGTGYGDPLVANQKASLTIGGKIILGTGNQVQVGGQNPMGTGPGYLILSKEGLPWLEKIASENNDFSVHGPVKTVSTTELDQIFNAYKDTLSSFNPYFDTLVASTEELDILVDDQPIVTLPRHNHWQSFVPITRSKTNSKVAVVNVPTEEDGKTAYIPQLHKRVYDALIENGFEQLVIESSAEKIMCISHTGDIIFNWTNGIGTSPAREYAKMTTFYLPNATQVTNFTNRDGDSGKSIPGTAPDITTNVNPDTGIKLTGTGEDGYGSDYFGSMECNTLALCGTLYAPNATVVWRGGNLNGYVFTHNLHLRESAETHNYYNPWLKDLFNPKPANLTVKKVDENNQLITTSPATFKLFQKDGEKEISKGEFLTENGKITFSDAELRALLPAEIQDGDKFEFVFKEITAPNGYIRSETEYPFTLKVEQVPNTDGLTVKVYIKEAEGKEISVTNQRQTAKLTFEKVDSKNPGASLAGATFELWKEAATNTWEKVVPDASSQLEANLTEMQTTGKTTFGSKVLESLSKDTRYYLLETQAPDGYILEKIDLNNMSITEKTKVDNEAFKITKDGVVIGKGTTTALEGSIKRENVASEIIIEKVDADKNKIIASNATFQLYKKSGKLPLNKDFKEEETAVTYDTTTLGSFTISKIPDGEYYFKEISAPSGYIQLKSNIDFKVENGKLVVDAKLYPSVVDTKTMKVENKETEITLKKTGRDADGKELGFINGAEFALFDSNSQYVDGYENIIVKNGELGFTLKKLPVGSYFFMETKAPPGYIQEARTAIYFTLNADGTISNVEAVHFSAMPTTLTASSEGTTITVSNQQNKIVVEKVDVNDTDILLDGAEFNLCRINDEAPSKYWFTGENYVPVEESAAKIYKSEKGVFDITGIPDGNYFLLEKKAPIGYEIIDIGEKIGKGRVYFSIEKGKLVQHDNGIAWNARKGEVFPGTSKIQVYNQRKGSLPVTGGNGIGMFIAIGLMVVLPTLAFALKFKLSGSNSKEGGM